MHRKNTFLEFDDYNKYFLLHNQKYIQQSLTTVVTFKVTIKVTFFNLSAVAITQNWSSTLSFALKVTFLDDQFFLSRFHYSIEQVL